jgi:PemK-like protein.
MDAEAVRPRIEPDQSNGLKSVSQVMIDKITTLPKTRLGVQIGMLGDEDMVRVNRSLAVFLGIGGSRA